MLRIGTIGAVLGILALAAGAPPVALAAGDAALTGVVSSPTDGAMEGVVVTAKRDGSIVSISVVSDKSGRYSFPADRLEPGHYSIAIRAAGYELDAPAAATADVATEATATHRPEAQEDEEARVAAHQRRMAREHAGDGRAEKLPPRLQRLPHLRAHRALDARRRRMGPGHHAHEGLCAGEPADQAATPAGRTGAPARPISTRRRRSISPRSI